MKIDGVTDLDVKLNEYRIKYIFWSFWAETLSEI